MEKEVDGLERNNTRTVIDSPPFGEKGVDSKWVFQWKTDEHGYVMKGLDWFFGVIGKKLAKFPRSYQPHPRRLTE
ncbi:unnamed protein product [Sphacelaria rigidula]